MLLLSYLPSLPRLQGLKLLHLCLQNRPISITVKSKISPPLLHHPFNYLLLWSRELLCLLNHMEIVGKRGALFPLLHLLYRRVMSCPSPHLLQHLHLDKHHYRFFPLKRLLLEHLQVTRSTHFYHLSPRFHLRLLMKIVHH